MSDEKLIFKTESDLGNRDVIQVIVTGMKHRSGRTTIAQLIQLILRQNGLSVYLESLDQGRPMSREIMEKNLAKLQQSASICVRDDPSFLRRCKEVLGED